MKAIVTLLVATCVATGAAFAEGESSIASAQKSLKEQGFYYGEITGKKDADTTAAIRRYQIRNGLQINGELNAETVKSLGLKSGASLPAPRSTPPPSARERPESPAGQPDTSDLRDGTPDPEEEPGIADPAPRISPRADEYAPGPRGLAPETSGALDGTPFEIAPPDIQQRVLVGAQVLLARQGYYRSGIDGIYGPGMAYALRAYQSRHGLEPNGRLDMETLASLGLLPGQQTRRLEPRRRIGRPPALRAPTGEPIYVPRR